MNYWHSIVLLFIWLIILTLTGRGIARCLPWRQVAHARLYLGPALGMAFFVLLSTACGWIFGARPWLAVPVTVGISLVALGLEKKPKDLVGVLWLVLAAALVISFGPLASVVRFGVYSIPNDTFAYLVHGQWLQEHPFRIPAAVDPLHPVYTQIAFYQDHGLRMGMSFFLAWIQAASGADWSIEVYPAAMATCLTSGALAIGGLVAALVPSRRGIALGWSLAAGTALSGFSYGTTTGFAPQMCGLTLMTALFALLANFAPNTQTNAQLTRAVFPLSLVFAAVGFAYSELLPFVGLTLGLFFAISFVSERKLARRWLVAGAIMLTYALLLWNAELFRMAKALGVQSKAWVGWPVAWSPWEFFQHAVGLRSGSGDGDTWTVSSPNLGRALTGLFAILLVVAIATGLSGVAGRRRYRGAGIFAGLCLAAFVYFRYGVAAPWPAGVGQTWNQFKLSNWSSPILLGLLGAGVAVCAKHRAGRIAAATGIVLFTGNNLYQGYAHAPARVAELMRGTGRNQNPLSVYYDLRAIAKSVAGNETVFLDLGGRELKSRQILAYFLHDLPVAADWSDDVYVAPWLPTNAPIVTLASCPWWIHTATPSDGSLGQGLAMRAGNLQLSRTPDFIASRADVTGGYGIESDGTGWWVWSADHVKVRFRISGRLPAQVSLKFVCVAAAEPRRLTIARKTKTSSSISETITVPEGWQNFTSVPFQLNDREIEINISSESTPVPIGGTDTRMVTFLAKNIRLEPVPASP